jgi:hypothetical protein
VGFSSELNSEIRPTLPLREGRKIYGRERSERTEIFRGGVPKWRPRCPSPKKSSRFALRFFRPSLKGRVGNGELATFPAGRRDGSADRHLISYGRITFPSSGGRREKFRIVRRCAGILLRGLVTDVELHVGRFPALRKTFDIERGVGERPTVDIAIGIVVAVLGHQEI